MGRSSTLPILSLPQIPFMNMRLKTRFSSSGEQDSQCSLLKCALLCWETTFWSIELFFCHIEHWGFLECNIMFTMNVGMLAPREGGYTIRFIFSHSNASEAKRFCLEHECPSNWNNANEDNCCVYHANIHSCPLALMVSGLAILQEELFDLVTLALKSS